MKWYSQHRERRLPKHEKSSQASSTQAARKRLSPLLSLPLTLVFSSHEVFSVDHLSWWKLPKLETHLNDVGCEVVARLFHLLGASSETAWRWSYWAGASLAGRPWPPCIVRFKSAAHSFVISLKRFSSFHFLQRTVRPETLKPRTATQQSSDSFSESFKLM